MFYTVTTWMVSYFLITSLTVHTVKSDSHVIVRPTDSDPSICGDHAVCDTLSNLISSKHALLSDSDLELEFLGGTHSITVSGNELKLENKTNITWHGQDAVIVCEKPFMFYFISIERLAIKNLIFSGCGNTIPNASLSNHHEFFTLNAALYLKQTSLLHFEAVRIFNSTGYGLFGFNLQIEASFAFCQFIDNNKNCETTEQDDCIGGNIAFHSYDVINSLQISINHSIIKGGTDGSRQLFSCEKKIPRRANGLAMVFHHIEHLVELSINNCSFTRNTGNSNHPSVLVYDDTGLKNQLTIQSSWFEEEGTLVISNLENSTCKETTGCYAANSGETKPTNLVRIINCIFRCGANTGLKICVSPTYVRNKRFGIITIKDSSFHNFSTHNSFSDQAVVRISYKFTKEEYPAFLIKMQHCLFRFNKISSVSLYLEQDIYLQNAKPYKHDEEIHPIVTLTSTSFISNRVSNSSTVIIAVGKRFVQAWCYPLHKQIINIEDCSFISNFAKGVLKVKSAYITLKSTTFNYSSGTALYAENATIKVEGQNFFNENHGDFGGAINLNKSMLFLMASSHINIINNTASNQGGGIFAIAYGIEMKKCSKQIKHNNYSYLCTINIAEYEDKELITLIGNKASSGSSIFGGQYSNCIGLYNVKNCKLTPEGNSQPIPSFINFSSDISSPATKLCLCDNSVPTDQCSSTRREVFPGQEFQILIVAMGDLGEKTSAVVTAKILKDKKLDRRFVSIGFGQQIKLLENNDCTNVSYQVNSDFKQETLELVIDEGGLSPKVFRSDPNVIQPFLVNVTFKHCPKGFNLSRKTGAPECKCENILNSNSNIKCDVNKGITIKGNMWIGLINNTNHNEIVIYENCPFDYCNCSSENCLKSIALESPEKQCNYNRSGTLCGACQNGYSNVLRTSNCKRCSNVYLLLIIPFALAGVALVVLLLKCNLTVSVGHINGIIFYANIVQVNKDILFPNQSKESQIFSTFIAWLNLDLGIETCFFKDMDSYIKVWLQFVFPVYVWIIIALIIFLVNCSRKLGTLIGNNAVPVLATLFYLSYAKLLRTIIAATAFTFIVFKDDSYITVWLRDGNVKYFDPKHIVLFLVALLFTFLYILPLTLLVLLAPCLQARSHHIAFRWVNRLKPFLDAYQGPYSDKFRFWTGLLLILRIVLFIIDAANYGNDPSMSFFCTIGVIIPLAMVLVRFGVYRHTLANCIELLSLLNLMILFAVSWLTTTTGYPKWHSIREYAAYISVGVTMLMFIGIILYQLLMAIHPKLIMVIYPKVFNRRDKSTEQTTGETAHAVSVEPPTSTTVELQECDQLKEPLLETN